MPVGPTSPATPMTTPRCSPMRRPSRRLASTRSATAHTAPMIGYDHSDTGRICAAERIGWPFPTRATRWGGLEARQGALDLGGGPPSRVRNPSIVIHPNERAVADRSPSAIEVIEAPFNDAWMRDIGPTFVHTATDGSVARGGLGVQRRGPRTGRSGTVTKIGRVVAEPPACRSSRRIWSTRAARHGRWRKRAAHRHRPTRPRPQPRASPAPRWKPKSPRTSAPPTRWLPCG